jgi:hypothetical protein
MGREKGKVEKGNDNIFNSIPSPFSLSPILLPYTKIEEKNILRR